MNIIFFAEKFGPQHDLESVLGLHRVTKLNFHLTLARVDGFVQEEITRLVLRL